MNESKPLLMFPRWSNKVTAGILTALLALPVYVGALLGYGANPTTLNVGYQPVQPVPYSHKLHVGELGMDCRYCHTTVEKAGMAALPPTEVCMNCHTGIFDKSEKLAPVFKSFADGTAVPWVKVHDLPDYVYFNHGAHVNVGVGCVECHGRVDQMDEKGVYQVSALNMAWCLECHRDPAPRLRPKDQVTNMAWGSTQDRRQLGEELMKKYHVNPSTDCVMCHR